MDANCSLNLNPVLKSLKNFCGSDETQFLEYFSKVFSSNPKEEELEARPEFAKWYKENYKKDLDLSKIGTIALKNAITKYYHKLVPTFNDTELSVNNTIAASFGYTSPLARKKGIDYIAHLIYKKYMNIERANSDKENYLSKIISDVIRDLRADIANMLAPTDDNEYREVFRNLRSNCGKYINNLINNSNDEFTPQLLNYLALYNELTSTYKENEDDRSDRDILLDTILNTKLITSLQFSRYDNADEIEDANNVSLNNTATDEDTDPDSADEENKQTDSFIRDANNHHGELDDYKKHLSERIVRILNTIPKLNNVIGEVNPESNDTELAVDLKIDPTIGFPEYLDSTEVAALLYSYVDKDDADRMIESIKAIANAFPEYAGLSILYNELKSNSDLKYHFYTHFGKHVISKAQTVLNNGITNYFISNANANRLTTLRNQFRNEFLRNAVDVSVEQMHELYDKITYTVIKGRKDMRTINGHRVPEILARTMNSVSQDDKVERAVKQFHDILSIIYPSVSYNSLLNYVCNNSDYNIQQALANLYSVVKSLCYDESRDKPSEITRIQKAIKDKQDRLKHARNHNRRLIWENTVKGANHAPSEFIDETAIRLEQPIKPEMLSSAIAFAELMLKYTLVKTNLNSVNVHGNQSSDVLNSSLITRLKSIFENPEKGMSSPLQALAEDYHLDTTTQFRLSNILIEQDGHDGIFRLVNGKYVPTEYANELIEFTLFNGASNRDTETDVLYNEMSKGDYIGTSWTNFFAVEDTSVHGRNTKLGRYFLRIPSDAPKTFIIKAPRYVVNESNRLFYTKNEGDYSLFLDEVLNRVTAKNINMPNEAIAQLGSAQPFIELSDNKEFLRQILSTGELTINLNRIYSDLDEVEAAQKIAKLSQGINKNQDGTVSILVIYKEDGNYIPYIISGTMKGTMIYNAKVNTFINADSSKPALRKILDTHYKDSFVNKGSVSYGDLTVRRIRSVEKNHQIFRQLKNAFKQELIDGVAAARLMFKTDVIEENGEPLIINGKRVYGILRDKLNPILKEEWAADLNGLSPVYHFNSNTAYKDGKLTGRVFESDRFIIFDENNVDENGNPKIVRNYGQELLDEYLRYLADAKHPTQATQLHWTEENGTFDLVLTDEQEQAIDAKIEEYINNFVDVSIERLNEMKDFLKGKKITIDNVADYMLNHQLMYINSNELLEGDTKYYKDVQTFLKRTKEYQASGNPYGVASIRRTLTSSPLEEIQIGPKSWNITLNDRFNAITFKTTKMFREKVLNSLAESLSDKKRLGIHAMSPEEAFNLIYGEDGKHGYSDAKVNDAQSYITFEEWVRRVAARGELDQYRNLINKLINKESLTKEDLTEFVQVQKNIYYDLYYDKVTNRVVPRQIKNAEFVLVPQLIEGTELEELYKFMKAKGIGQINTDETSKASNNYIVDLFDAKGNLHEDVINFNRLEELNSKENKTKEDNDAIAKANKFDELITKAIQPYSYNYLYEQQKVPQHLFADNKLAIQIAKKIIDNIQKDHPLYYQKQRYFDIMTTNIKESFINLMKEFNIPINDNGDLGEIDETIYKDIDYQKFYDKLKKELGRLGLDENSLDYATLNENGEYVGETIMPNYFGIMINKLESIVQSLVTKAVTRQTLHGFHAAQITNIGHVKLGDKNTIGVDNKLKYHPAIVNKATGEVTQEAYAEIKISYAAFGIDRHSEHYKNMTDAEILAELEEKGLDKFIGYRIPTEGKQSIAVMKIVEFLPDEYGSTIVLPIEWVPQTGSDFDVDSVYGIMHKVKINKRTGEVHNIKFKEDFTRSDWYNYVNASLGNNINPFTKDIFEDIKAEAKQSGKAAVKEKRNNEKKALQELETEAYSNLPGKYYTNKAGEQIYQGAKGGIRKIHEAMNEAYGKEASREKYEDQLKNEHAFLTQALDRSNLTEEEIQAVDEYDAVIVKILNSITDESNAEEEKAIYDKIKNEKLKELIDREDKAKKELYESVAAITGLLSEEDYLKEAKADPVKYNNRTARDNEIVNIMVGIMSHPYSLEENLSRSNFDNITGTDNSSVDKLRNKVEKDRRKYRSPYNILDEAEFQEDAMQGFALKGFSVSRDTFCSICNQVRPTIALEYAPVIEYDFSHLTDAEFESKLKTLKLRYNDENQENVTNNGKVVTVRHNKIGWSNGNSETKNGRVFTPDKNIDGKYVTVYTSQTTAHILDAIKSGPVPNVNKYTFGVFKTLVDIGSNYDTAVGFIMHPAIAVINKYYNRTNSIYASDVSNRYIESALDEYCDKLNEALDDEFKFTRKTTLQEKLDAINKKYGSNLSTDYINNNLAPINQKDIELRVLNEEAYINKHGVVGTILNDMAHVLNFAKVMELTKNIESVQQLTNPDKFGAKQTIFDTERVFKNILDYVQGKYVLGEDNRLVNKSVLSVNGKDILEAIYPDLCFTGSRGNTFDEAIQKFASSSTNVENSAYPTLCAHLKYGSCTSIIVNKAFFITQTPSFRTYINSIEKMFSDNKKLDNKTYKELRSYLINAAYRRTGFINSTLAYTKDKGFEFKKGDVRVSNEEEYARIFGYSRTSYFEIPGAKKEDGTYEYIPVTIANISDPTQDEINAFAALSPAQKVEFIKGRIKGESIFDYIRVTLDSTIRTRNTSPGAQLMNFVESSADIDYLRDLFYKAFTNKNPIIALAAADIVKYAFVVDNYSFTRNGVSKLIPNNVLLNDGPIYGTNIVSDTNEIVSRLMLYLDETHLENFIRSHPNLRQINTRRVKNRNGIYDLGRIAQDIIIISPSMEDIAKTYGIVQTNGSFNSYVRLKFGDENILYKINPFETGYAMLTPLNDLERNENTNWSANDYNNKYPGVINGIDYFEDLIDRYRQSRAALETGISDYNLKKVIAETTPSKFKAVSYTVKNDKKARQFDVKANTPLGQKLLNNAAKIANNPDKPYRFFYDLNIDKYMEDADGILVSIPIKSAKEDGKYDGTKLFKVSPIFIKDLYDYFEHPRKDRSELSQKQRDILESLETEMHTRSIARTFSHMFQIEEVFENVEENKVNKIKFSTIGHKAKPIVQATMNTIQGINYLGNVVKEEKASILARDFDQRHIFAREKVAEAHVQDVIIPAAKTIEESVRNIEDSFKQFMEVPGEPGHYYEITHPEVIKRIKYDLPLREKYLRAIMNSAAVASRFEIFNALNIDSEDAILRPYLTKIKKSVDDLTKIHYIKEAQEIYINEVLDKLSNNPDILNGTISVVSGFYKQSILNGMFNDIQESPNALVQVTMKMIQDNLRYTEMQTEIDIDNFVKTVDDIKARAKAEGLSINYDNILDEYWRFKRNYKEKLNEDKNRLQKSRDDAKFHWINVRDSKPNNELSTESIKSFLDYKRTELEYNEWKAKYVEQEALNEHNTKAGIEDDGYYNTKNKLTRQMLDGPGTKYIYAIYEILRNKRSRLMRRRLDDVDDEELEKQIDDLNTKLRDLRADSIFDPVTFTSTEKTVYSGLASNEDEMIRRAWDDKAASLLLDANIKAQNTNETKYYKFAPKEGFEQLVIDNRAIVEKYEKPLNGIPTVSQEELKNNVEYQKAKKWLRRNAEVIYIEQGDSTWIEELSNAYDILHDTSTGLGITYHNIYNNSKYKDENGDIDGIEVSKDVDLINKIRDEQQRAYNVFKENDFSDRKLISLAPADDLVYSDEYWNAITGGKGNKSQARDEYIQTITAINNILAPYYNEANNFIDWSSLFENNSHDEVQKVLVLLNALYDKLDNISKGTGNGKETYEFIQNNCETVSNESRYSADMIFASTLGNDTNAHLFRRLIKEHNKDNTPGNSYLYKSFRIKGHSVFSQLANITDKDSDEFKSLLAANKDVIDKYGKYIDFRKTYARRIVSKYTYRTNTKYYDIAKNEVLKEAERIGRSNPKAGKDYYRQWFFRNHIYNPYERKFEPIAIWSKTAINAGDNSDIEMDWSPSYAQTKRVVRDGHDSISDIQILTRIQEGASGRISKYVTSEELEDIKDYNEDHDTQNKKYKPGYGHAENYKFGSNAEYDNPNTMNKYEQEMSDYLQQLETSLVEDEQSQHYIKRGWAPAMMKGESLNAKFVGNEFKKLMGFASYDSGRGTEAPTIDYAHDKYTPTPMLSLITGKFDHKNEIRRPIREECLSEDEYLAKKRKWDAEEEKIRKEKLELHKSLHNRDLEYVFKEFIRRANRHNSIQHNKVNFYMAQQLLNEYGVYRQKYGKEGDFKKDGSISAEDQAEYIRTVDKEMLDQFEVTMRRFINNEWKSPEGSLTRYLSMLQAMTSAKFMILNHKGGVSNVTYGEASIYSEAKAREEFSLADDIKGHWFYRSGIIDYMSHMYSETSSTLAGAIVKQMNIVDYDEQSGLTHIQQDLAEVSKRLNDFAYSAQSAGEHYMQNSTMFAMMYSHRLVLNPRHNEFGQPKYTFMNITEYTRMLEENTLLEMLSPEEKKEYEAFKERISSDANSYKRYAWYREDFASAYMKGRFGWDRKSEYNRRRKENMKNLEKEFNDDEVHPTIMSQLKLGDNGKLAFIEGSLMAEMDNMNNGHIKVENEKGSDALRFLAEFKGRVISVNKRIHGSYDKSGRAKVENKWWGSIVMQYHKHLPIGLAKRYRSKGYFNEERGTKEKGTYVSIEDFIATPFKKHQALLELGDEEVDALIGVQNLLKDYLDFAFHIKTAYGIMPEYDKANIRRAIADFQAMFGALFAAIGLQMVATDDDKSKWWYNFTFYQVDKFATESSQYMPWVLPQEAKKFFGNPVAGFKEVDDLLSSASFMVQLIMGTVGLSDFETTYESGTNAGRNKLAVYIERNIPFWRGIRSAYIDINDNNKAYKTGKNLLGFIDAEVVAEKLK